jgi:hypothetical protein
MSVLLVPLQVGLLEVAIEVGWTEDSLEVNCAQLWPSIARADNRGGRQSYRTYGSDVGRANGLVAVADR